MKVPMPPPPPPASTTKEALLRAIEAEPITAPRPVSDYLRGVTSQVAPGFGPSWAARLYAALRRESSETLAAATAVHAKNLQTPGLLPEKESMK